MSTTPDKVPEIFDRKARQLRRRRATGRGFFAETLTTDLLERLDIVQRSFSNALLIGDQPLLAEGLRGRRVPFDVYRGDEDQMQASSTQYDLILSSGTLDTIADLPGALLLMRRALIPDGLLLANFAAAPSLAALRLAITAANAGCGRDVARLHPQIDVRSAGDLLMRAGFALPVADLDTLDIAYAGLSQLLNDLRDAGATNVLMKRYPVSRRWLATADAAFAGGDGRTHETLSFVTLTAWAPAPTQPQPARRGSATTSLTDALRRRQE